MTQLIDLNGKPLVVTGKVICDVMKAGKKCENIAVFRVGALLWAKGAKAGSHEPIPVLSNLNCCLEHEKFPTLENCFPEQARTQIIANIIRQGKREPDFATAKIQLVPLRR